MNRIHKSAAALLLLACTAPAQSAEPIRGALRANPTGEISINVVRGNVTVVGVDGDEVRVEGTRDEASREFVFERDGDAVRIRDKLPHQVPRGAGTQLTVHVPRGSRVRTQLVSADLDIANLTAPVRLNTVSGSVTARDLRGDAEITTVSGSQSIERAAGELRLQSISGRIEGRTVALRLTVKSVSGEIDIANTHPLRRGDIKTVSGKVRLKTAVDPDVEIEMETVSGDGALALTGDLNLRLGVVGNPGGSIHNRIDDTPARKAETGPGERLEAILGEGRGNVRVSTISGTLTLTRE